MSLNKKCGEIPHKANSEEENDDPGKLHNKLDTATVTDAIDVLVALGWSKKIASQKVHDAIARMPDSTNDTGQIVRGALAMRGEYSE